MHDFRCATGKYRVICASHYADIVCDRRPYRVALWPPS